MRTKRFAAMTAAMTLALTMSMTSLTAFATDPDLEAPNRGAQNASEIVTVKESGHTYRYLQIFTGTWYDEDDAYANGEEVNDIGYGVWLTDAEWGTALPAARREAMINYLKATYGNDIKDMMLRRAKAAKLTNLSTGNAPTSYAQIEAAVKSHYTGTAANEAWAASSYNFDNFGQIENHEVEDVLDLFKYWQKDLGDQGLDEKLSNENLIPGNSNPDGIGGGTASSISENMNGNVYVVDEGANHTTADYNGQASDHSHKNNVTKADKRIIDILSSFVDLSTATELNANYNDDKTTTVDNGYYLIIETDEGWDKEGRDLTQVSKTATMMKIIDRNITVKPKLGTPTLEKKIAENVKAVESVGNSINNDEGTIGLRGGYRDITKELNSTNHTAAAHWNDAADFSIGDSVPFVLFGTVPENIDDFDHFYYQFKDTLAHGFKKPTNVKIEIGTVSAEAKPSDADNAAASRSFTGTDVTSKFTINIPTAATGSDTVMTYTANDLKALGVDITKDTVIRVTYNAVMDTDAVIGKMGNTNGASLVYTSDINYDGTGISGSVTTTPGNSEVEHNTTGRKKTSLSETLQDGVTAFTYELDLTKVDGEDLTKRLNGAIFTLQAKSGVHSGQYVTIYTEDDPTTGAKNCVVSGWADDYTSNESTHLTTRNIDAEDGMIKIKGLDDGVYELVEIKAARGYNSLRDPIPVTISTMDVSGENTMNDDGTYTYVKDDGSAAYGTVIKNVDDERENNATVDSDRGLYAVTVLNNKGIVLPQTGGAGTVMLYVSGGVMLLTCGIYAASKKKKNSEG